MFIIRLTKIQWILTRFKELLMHIERIKNVDKICTVYNPKRTKTTISKRFKIIYILSGDDTMSYLQLTS